jgi:hypothetical protein
MNADFVQTFRRRLAETIARCSAQPSLAAAPELLATWRSNYETTGGRMGDGIEWLAPVLRTPELEPRGFEYPATAAQRAEIMERLAETRAALLRDAGLYPTNISGDLAGGRLLLHDPDGSDSSGDSWVSSSGLFDGEDAPPWDCWITFVHQGPDQRMEWESCVVSWIPPSLLAVAELGVWAKVFDCVKWADEADLPIAPLLRAEGLSTKID